MILTVGAPQGASREEDGATACLAADRRLLPMVQHHMGYEQPSIGTACSALPS